MKSHPLSEGVEVVVPKRIALIKFLASDLFSLSFSGVGLHFSDKAEFLRLKLFEPAFFMVAFFGSFTINTLFVGIVGKPLFFVLTNSVLMLGTIFFRVFALISIVCIAVIFFILRDTSDDFFTVAKVILPIVFLGNSGSTIGAVFLTVTRRRVFFAAPLTNLNHD